MMHKFSNCRECRALLVDDYQSGELVCSHCGIVAREAPADTGPAPFSLDGTASKNIRASGPNTYAQHDMGLATTIGEGSFDYNGKPLDRTVRAQMKGIRRWQQRVRVSGAKDRRVSAALVSITDACNALDLRKNVLETASILYRRMNNRMDLRGKSTTGVTAAVIYMACKQCDVVRSISEIVGRICPPKEVRSKTRLASKYYRMMVMETGSPRSMPMPMTKYISKISNISETDVRAERLALLLADRTQNETILSGRDPHGIAAAYLFMACILLGHDNMQRDIAEAAGVTEVTARNRCKEIFAAYDIALTLKPTAR
ncbi:MAG: transcription factor IIB [Thaumarchaeota archaeon]|nr:transcription factor IIB [Nitrososphaerota archaeon]